MTPPGIRLRHGDLRFLVRAADRRHLAWLAAFLRPHFTRAPGPSADVTVSLVIAPARWRRNAGLLRGAAARPAFVYDSRVRALPCAALPGGGWLLYEKPYRAFHEVSRDRRRVTIVAKRDAVGLRTPLMRVVREYVMNDAQRRDAFFLHAACFQAGGRSVIVTGPRKAGKTSLLVFACRSGRVRYLSNDRICVRRRGGAYELGGMPVIINIREGTFDFFPDVKRRLLAARMHHRLHDAERPDPADPRQRIGDDGSYGISTLQFCSLVGVRPAARGARPVVVIPRLTHAPGAFRLERLGPEQAYQRLQGSLFGARYWAASTPIFNLGGGRAPARARLQALCRRFAGAVPVLACEVGRDLYRGPRSARAWIDAVLRAAATPTRS